MSGFQQLSQTSGYRTPNEQKRAMSIKNMSGEEIPGFAACVLRQGTETPGGSAAPSYNQEMVGGDVVWHVYKPDDNSEGLQDASMIIINGPTPIPNGQIGEGSQDWPLQSLSVEDEFIVNGTPCGLKSGSWSLSRDGDAFTHMSADKARPKAAQGQKRPVWVSPRDTALPVMFSLGFASQQGFLITDSDRALRMLPVFADNNILTSTFSTRYDSIKPVATANFPEAIDSADPIKRWHAVRVPVAGYYMVNVCVTIVLEGDHSDGASIEYFRSIRVQAKDERFGSQPSWVDTYMTAGTGIEDLNPGNSSYGNTHGHNDIWMNVACSGILKIAKDTYIRINGEGSGGSAGSVGFFFNSFSLSITKVGGIGSTDSNNLDTYAGFQQ